MWMLEESSSRFEAAPSSPSHDRKCARVHGHSWVGVVEVDGRVLVGNGHKVGMVVDYGDISAAVEPLVDVYLDHWDLNDTTGLEKSLPRRNSPSGCSGAWSIPCRVWWR